MFFIQMISDCSIPNKTAVNDNVSKMRQQESNFYRWVEAYRTHAHRIAQTNPIEIRKNARYFSRINLFFFVFIRSFLFSQLVRCHCKIECNLTKRNLKHNE